jgi:hypothetical protein
MPTIRHNAIARRQPSARHRAARHSVLIEGQQTVGNGDAKSINAACDAYFRRHAMQPEPGIFGHCHMEGSH